MNAKKLPPRSRPTAFAPASVLTRKIRSGISGTWTRVSTARNTASRPGRRSAATPSWRCPSIRHCVRAGINFDDLQWERSYSRVGAYGQSKLASLMLTYELQRRLSGPGTTIAVAAHPGFAATELMRHLPAALAVPAPLFSQKAAMGALATPHAATDPGVLGGQYYGPAGFFGTRGYPKLAKSSGQSRDTAIQHRLWTVTEELTGVTFPV